MPKKFFGTTSFAFLPGLGAGTLGARAALSVGWNLQMLFILDGDDEGRAQRRRYVSEFEIAANRAVTLNELNPKISVIEDTLDEEARGIVAENLKASGTLSKSQIQRFSQERLASNNVTKLGIEFESKVQSILEGITIRFQ